MDRAVTKTSFNSYNNTVIGLITTFMSFRFTYNFDFHFKWRWNNICWCPNSQPHYVWDGFDLGANVFNKVYNESSVHVTTSGLEMVL